MDKKLAAAVTSIRKQFGAGSIMELGDSVAFTGEVIPTGIRALDEILGIGGLPKGRVVEIYGPECVDADTFVQYVIMHDGKRANSKGGTIRRLYERFHGLPPSGNAQGKYQRSITIGAEFHLVSFNELGRIVKNKISDVVSSGKKECFTLQTDDGESITASADHQFWVGDCFKSLRHLSVGDDVWVHNNTPFRVDKKKDSTKERMYLYVRNHGVARRKKVNPKDHKGNHPKDYFYYTVLRSRAVIEAKMNGMSFEQYVERLNSEDISGLEFLPRTTHVHHKDEDVTNDAWDNLEVISDSAHGVLHATERHNNLRFTIVPTTITSIIPAGIRDTYDIQMEEPYRNYIANGFAVHNSGGKTTLTLHIIAEAQKLGNVAAFIDAEHALNPEYARHLGVNTDRLLISQPDCGEEALEIAESLIRSEAVGLVVVDSVAALVPKAELEGSMGDPQMGLQARLMSQALRKLTGITSKSGTLLIFINQVRDKIGMVFGNPETTTGGRALKFYSSVRIDIRKSTAIKKGDNVIGYKTKIKIVKHKSATPYKAIEIPQIFGEGFREEE